MSLRNPKKNTPKIKILTFHGRLVLIKKFTSIERFFGFQANWNRDLWKYAYSLCATLDCSAATSELVRDRSDKSWGNDVTASALSRGNVNQWISLLSLQKQQRAAAWSMHNVMRFWSYSPMLWGKSGWSFNQFWNSCSLSANIFLSSNDSSLIFFLWAEFYLNTISAAHLINHKIFFFDHYRRTWTNINLTNATSNRTELDSVVRTTEQLHERLNRKMKKYSIKLNSRRKYTLTFFIVLDVDMFLSVAKILWSSATLKRRKC